MRVLGIETSCDETAAAIVTDGGAILSNVIFSQVDDHAVFGGVVPEIAARAHMDVLEGIVAKAFDEAGITLAELDGVAATCGPGLIGGVIVGMMAGKTMASIAGKPFIGINHLEGHALSPRLSDKVPFPYLMLLVSGGHTQILIAEDVGVYHLLGTTRDDAAGECFDKSAKMMGLRFPGGPHLARLAARCADRGAAGAAFPLPRPLKGRDGCDFSFSGLKTSVRQHCEAGLFDEDKILLAAALEDAVADVLADRCRNALAVFRSRYGHVDNPHLVACGGVAANAVIRERLIDLTGRHGMIFTAPPASLCTDNGAMIAWAGVERLQRGLVSGMDMKARPRWPLEDLKDRII